MASPARRVLGPKDTNAPLQQYSATSLKPNNSSTVNTTKASTTARVMADSPSTYAGSKRKIEYVEDAERVEHEARSPKLSLLSDSDHEEQTFYQPTQTSSFETNPTIPPASQLTAEQSFEMPGEEMSQNTLEQLGDVPMPQNTSQLPPSVPGLLQEISAGSVGLSKYLNFEDFQSTQGSEGMIHQTQPEKDLELLPQNEPALEPVVVYEESPEDARKRDIAEKIAQMQTRLQLAMYKVETKQTTQPFSRLKSKSQHTRQRSSPTIPTLSTPKLSSSSTVRPNQSYAGMSPDSWQTDAAEAHIAAMRAQATAQTKPPVRDLSSLPMPQLDPALMGAGPLQIEKSDPSEGSERTPQLPSSPPLSRQNSETDASQLRILSDLAESAAVQLSSPPVSIVEESQGLTATVSHTQGEAASGLVKLMTGR